MFILTSTLTRASPSKSAGFHLAFILEKPALLPEMARLAESPGITTFIFVKHSRQRIKFFLLPYCEHFSYLPHPAMQHLNIKREMCFGITITNAIYILNASIAIHMNAARTK